MISERASPISLFVLPLNLRRFLNTGDAIGRILSSGLPDCIPPNVNRSVSPIHVTNSH